MYFRHAKSNNKIGLFQTKIENSVRELQEVFTTDAAARERLKGNQPELAKALEAKDSGTF